VSLSKSIKLRIRKFGDIKRVIRRPKSKTDRQSNDQKKTKDRETQIPLKPGVSSGSPEGLAVTARHVIPVVLSN